MGIKDNVGMVEIVKMDSKGRILIPKAVRDKTELTEGAYVKVETEGKRIIIEPTESAATKYRGLFKVDNLPDDLDQYVESEIFKRWLEKNT